MKRGTEAMTRRHIWIEDETWDTLEEIYGESIGQSAAVRQILKAFLASLRAKAERKGTALPPVNLEDL